MARKRLSAREVKQGRAAQVGRNLDANLKQLRIAVRAIEDNAKQLKELLAELTEKESPPCSDSGPSSPS